MRVLVTNDDGPPNTEFSPYIRPFVQNLVKLYPDWKITVCVPNVQKSWISKAHLAGKSLKVQYIYSKIDANDNIFMGPYIQSQLYREESNLPYEENDEIENNSIEWILIDGTPASCTNIALHHLIKYKFDLVISGPNVGRNSSSAFITSSATVGAAMESVITSNTPSIAVSWGYFNGNKQVKNNKLLTMASKRSLDVIEHLWNNWDRGTDLYCINVPLLDSLDDNTEVHYATIWENRGISMFDAPVIKPIGINSEIEDAHEAHTISFNWNPKFASLSDSKHTDPNIRYDKHVLEDGQIAVTPLRAKFHCVDHLIGQLKLNNKNNNNTETEIDTKTDSQPVNTKDTQNYNVAITINKNEYIYEPLHEAITKHLINARITNSIKDFTEGSKVFQYGDYEQLDVDRLMSQPDLMFANSYIYRKALIRKHYLSNTIHNYIVKHPESILNNAYLESYTIDLDYAEFLDDSLDENWELRQELEKEDRWWIVKPSMSDKGQGIRVFKTIEDLQAIFDSFDDDYDVDDEPVQNTESQHIDNNKIIISQLRHFIIQEYLANPLLLPSNNNKKFHIRCYITCKGDLQVFVYDRMLALFAPTPFKALTKNKNQSFNPIDLNNLECHLTNTCLQTKNEHKELSVMEFDNLTDISTENKLKIKEQIHKISQDIFLAAINVNRLNFQPLANAFETYGVDFLVDDQFNVKLLEINAYPDFKQTGNDLKGLIDELFDNTVQYCIKPLLDGSNDLPNPQTSNFQLVLNHKSNEW